MQRREEGFSLIELMVVLLIIAVLLAIAIPVFMGWRENAMDTDTRQLLASAAKIESGFAANATGFTTDAAALALLEPSIDFSGGADDSVHVVVADAVSPGDNGQVLLYSRSDSGAWHGLRLVQAGPAAGRHTCIGNAEANVDDMADCSGVSW
ncbi:MAG: prepilin-type N-terminal cleavage/methylation domain-containing protein [Acidimicrobiia bacterium]|nr:prepilin-type N-terminal cleavage/methylation domain-containing protein [Acidimicrobiia bacterium]MDH3469786.1 prepilin-type N-terminal cleavage/methylation domain-containing protein [Acidimicrobiia bacterium]